MAPPYTHTLKYQRWFVGNVHVLVLKFYDQPEGGSVLKQRPEHSLPFRMGIALCVCELDMPLFRHRCCPMTPVGLAAMRTDKQTHTPSLLRYSFSLLNTHTRAHALTLGKPQECCVVLLGREHSPVHGLSMERWNVRTLERQKEVGEVKEGRVKHQNGTQWDNVCV